MLEELDEKSFDLSRVLLNLKYNLDIYRVIAVNALQINRSGLGKSFFAYTQKLALDSCVISICKLFEKEKKLYELNSIPGVIRYLQDKNIKCINVNCMKDFFKNNDLEYKKGEEVEALKLIYIRFYDKNTGELKKIKDLRDKRIAHIENVPEREKLVLSSYDVMERFFNFGIEFYSVVREAYAGSFPVLIKDEQKVLNGLLHLLELKGIKDIKNDFDD